MTTSNNSGTNNAGTPVACRHGFAGRNKPQPRESNPASPTRKPRAQVRHTDATTPNRTAISLAFGLAVLVAVYLFIHTSGAHINPTVTICLAVIGKFPLRAVPIYILAQLVGGILAALSLRGFFGDQARSPELLLGATQVGERGRSEERRVG